MPEAVSLQSSTSFPAEFGHTRYSPGTGRRAGSAEALNTELTIGHQANHCFVGRKLWLAWDRREAQARFDVKNLTEIRTSHWLLVADNRCLFMHGHFTHKVVTPDPCIGFGSFSTSLPAYRNTIKRWSLHETTDVTPSFLEAMTDESDRILHRIAPSPSSTRERMRYGCIESAAADWRKGLGRAERSRLASDLPFRRLLTSTQAA